MSTDPPAVTLAAVAQDGRLAFEALVLAASLQARGRPAGWDFVLLEPQPGPLWPADPRLRAPFRAALEGMGARIVPFESRHFGAAYPHGNKIEGLAALPPDRPFLFLDTDTLIVGDPGRLTLDFDRPTAGLKRSFTWPRPQPGGPPLAAIWRDLYARFGLDPAVMEDAGRSPDDWRRFPYYNAGWFFGPCPVRFGAEFTRIATAIRDQPGPILAGQSLDPWLDQVALPLVLHAMGGGGAAGVGLLDGEVTRHYRLLPLFYATATEADLDVLEEVCRPNHLKRLLKQSPAFHRMIYRGAGRRLRAALAAEGPFADEAALRRAIRRHGAWLR